MGRGQAAAPAPRTCTHDGELWPSRRLSLTSRMACGKRVISVRATGSEGSRYQRPVAAQLGPSSGFSLIMHMLVSRLMRTVASKGI